MEIDEGGAAELGRTVANGLEMNVGGGAKECASGDDRAGAGAAATGEGRIGGVEMRDAEAARMDGTAIGDVGAVMKSSQASKADASGDEAVEAAEDEDGAGTTLVEELGPKSRKSSSDMADDLRAGATDNGSLDEDGVVDRGPAEEGGGARGLGNGIDLAASIGDSVKLKNSSSAPKGIELVPSTSSRKPKSSAESWRSLCLLAAGALPAGATATTGVDLRPNLPKKRETPEGAGGAEAWG